MVDQMFPAFRSKNLSWADHTDEEEMVKSICEQSTITLEEFVQVIHYLMPKCDVDTTKTSHHFKIDNVCYDLMYRRHLVLSISGDDREKRETGKHEMEEKHETRHENSSVSSDESQDDVKQKRGTEKRGTEIQDDTGWTTVGREKKTVVKYHVFSSDVSSPFMDYVECAETEERLVELSQQYRWIHAYSVRENKVYSFNKFGEHSRVFTADHHYMRKFDKWMAECKQNADDKRVFFVCNENSTWPTWTVLSEKITGLENVRKAVLQSKSDYGHAYCPETNELVNFWMCGTNPKKTKYRFQQRLTSAPDKYVERYKQFILTTTQTSTRDSL